MGKSKEISQNLRGKNGDLHKSGSSLGAMGPRSRHTAQEGDAFCLLVMNVLWCEKCKSIPEQQQRTLWRCWRKWVQGRSHCPKTGIKKTTAHGDKDHTFWRNVLWSNETKIELIGHNDHRYVWMEKGEVCKPKNTIPIVKHVGGSIMLWGCFAAVVAEIHLNSVFHNSWHLILVKIVFWPVLCQLGSPFYFKNVKCQNNCSENGLFLSSEDLSFTCSWQ